MTKEVSIPYTPRPQFLPFHTRNQRWAVLVCHRRAGKTVATINDILTKAIYSQKERPRYGYIAPFYSQAKQIAWDYLKFYAKEVAVKTSESALSVELFNGARITLYGADNPDAFRGLYFDGVAVDEYGNCRPNLWSEILRPALSDRKGWALFIGTPNGPNHFYDVWEQAGANETWYRFMLKASESGILDPAEMEDMKREMPADEWESEMECSWFAAVKGSYYGTEMQRAKIGDFPPVPDVESHYVFDLGYTDTTAIWRWQEFPDHILVSFAMEWNARAIEFYINWLHAQREAGFRMGNVWLPHDAKAKSLQTGRSIVEQFLTNGIRPKLVPNLSIQDGISAARMMFRHLVFDEAGTYEGLKALKSYKRDFNEEKKVFMDKPLHDWASNFADSFRYLSLVARMQAVKPLPAAPKPYAVPLHYAFALDDIWSTGASNDKRIQ